MLYRMLRATIKNTMTLKKAIPALALFGIFVIGLFFMSLVNRNPKTGYVNLMKVFESFTGKKELENKLQQETWGNQKYLDSLSLDLQGFAEQMEKYPANDQLRQQVVEKQQQLNTTKARIDQYTSNRHQQLTEQVWSQINQYVKDYGKEKEYDYIFGADGAGTLMYGSENKDLTESIIKYLNNKYEGH